MEVEFGDNATYPMIGISFRSFSMPLGDVLELNDFLFVPSLMKNPLFISAIIDLQCVVEFND
jgi:hypothetical protein